MKIVRLDSQVFAVNCDPVVADVTGVDVRHYMTFGVEYRRIDTAKCTDCGIANYRNPPRNDLVVVCEDRPRTDGGYLRSLCPEHAEARAARLSRLVKDWNFA